MSSVSSPRATPSSAIAERASHTLWRGVVPTIALLLTLGAGTVAGRGLEMVTETRESVEQAHRVLDNIMLVQADVGVLDGTVARLADRQRVYADVGLVERSAADDPAMAAQVDTVRRALDAALSHRAPEAGSVVTVPTPVGRVLASMAERAKQAVHDGDVATRTQTRAVTLTIMLALVLVVLAGAWGSRILMDALASESATRTALHRRTEDLEVLSENLAQRSAIAERARDDATNLVERMSDAFLAVDRRGLVTFANSAATALATEPTATLIGRPVWDAVAPALAEWFAPPARNTAGVDLPIALATRPALARASRLGVREAVIDDATTGRQFVMRVHPTPDGWSVILQDMTERRAIERALAASQGALRHLAESNVLGVVTLSGDRVVEANAHAMDTFGWSPAALAAGTLTWRGVVPARDMAADGTTAPVEVEYQRADGTPVPMLVTGALVDPVTDTRVLLIVDLSASRAAAGQLRAFQNQLHQLYESGLVGIATLDAEGVVRHANGAFLALVGAEAAAIAAGTLRDDALALPSVDPEATGVHHAPLETTLRRVDGTDVPVLASRAPLTGRDGDGAVGESMLIVLDRTARAEADAERDRLWAIAAAARAHAEQANDAKLLFLASMSHELRTPLNAIFGFAEMLEMGVRGPVTATQQKDLQRIQHNGKQLLGRIDDILNYSGFDPVTLKDAAVCIDVEALLRPLAVQLQAAAAPHGLMVTTEPVPVGLAALADHGAVTTVLENLMGNALKFTPRGGRITLRTTSTDTTVAITVLDTGPGLAAADQERVFVPFTQVLTSDTAGDGTARRPPGIGLGLAISRRLARGMHGEVTVHSELGQGAAFTLTLPRTDDVIL